MAKQAEPDSATFDMPTFAEFFAADVAIVSKPFMVGEREARLEFRPMDADAARRFESVGFKYTTNVDPKSGSSEVKLTEIDLAERELFLVKNTLIGGFVWRHSKVKDSDQVVWTQEFIPEAPRARDTYIVGALKVTPGVWDWIVACCVEVNGLSEGTAKN